MATKAVRYIWVGGNKRTATTLVSIFLKRNGFRLTSITKDNVEMSLSVEADQWKVDEIEAWLRQRIKVIS